jgi:polysaccharide pyruvyl transferase WcaK-like protein
MALTDVSKKIGLLHHTSGANLGDEGSLGAVIQNIKERWPDALLFAFSMNPEDTRSRHGIASYPMRRQIWGFARTPANTPPPSGSRVAFKQNAKAILCKYRLLFSFIRALNVALRFPSDFYGELLFLIKSFRIIRSLDLLVITGGGQFVESSRSVRVAFGGSWQFPFTMFKWTLLARLAGVESFAINVGAGPLIRPLSKWFVRRALSFTDYASFRDEESRALVYRIGFRRKTAVFPDNVYSLETPAAKIISVEKRNKATVGFAPMAYGDPRLSPDHDPAAYAEFIQQLGMFGSWLIKSGYCVNLFCTDISVDPPAVEDVQRAVRSDTESLSRVHQWTTEELLMNMSSMDYVIACRFHTVVFAHLLNIPVFAIAHHPKVSVLMNNLGMSEYCVDITKLDSNVLTEKFSALVFNRDEIKSRMSDKLTLYRKELSIQFDELFPNLTDLKTLRVYKDQRSSAKAPIIQSQGRDA